VSTVPDAPPEAGPDRALEAPPAGPPPGPGNPDAADGEAEDAAQPAVSPITATISTAAAIPRPLRFDGHPMPRDFPAARSWSFTPTRRHPRVAEAAWTSSVRTSAIPTTRADADRVRAWPPDAGGRARPGLDAGPAAPAGGRVMSAYRPADSPARPSSSSVAPNGSSQAWQPHVFRWCQGCVGRAPLVWHRVRPQMLGTWVSEGCG
jgi:hypothetical protein